MEHLSHLISKWLPDLDDTCIVVPCDSTEAWVVAAYDEIEGVESIRDPWNSIIAKKKDYHKIRIHGNKKRMNAFKSFGKIVCENWDKVIELCVSAKQFEDDIIYLSKNIRE